MSDTAAARGPRPTSAAPGRCPACGSDELVPILEQTAPVHTSTLLPTRDAATAYPRGRITLEVCTRCGLLTNTSFDAPGHDYSASYEETQAFSGRFQEYANELVADLVERHDLVGTDVFEIGCGQADFLRRLCVATGGRGVGIDPSWRPEHLEGEASDRMRVERAFFERSQVDAPFGLIACRHTLEHVHDVSGFLAELRQALASQPRTPVFFEVPDTGRILRENAFWDIFYEHCSYFTPGSAARAFRAAGFRPTDVRLGFDDQYILLTAVADGKESVVLPGEDAVAEIVALASSFADGVSEARAHWQNVLGAARERGETVVIWGAGSKGVGFLATLGLDAEIACAVDVNPSKHGMFMPGTGHEIVPPERLVALAPDLVIVLNPAYAAEIARDIQAMGLNPAVEVL